MRNAQQNTSTTGSTKNPLAERWLPQLFVARRSSFTALQNRANDSVRRVPIEQLPEPPQVIHVPPEVLSDTTLLTKSDTTPESPIDALHALLSPGIAQDVLHSLTGEMLLPAKRALKRTSWAKILKAIEDDRLYLDPSPVATQITNLSEAIRAKTKDDYEKSLIENAVDVEAVAVKEPRRRKTAAPKKPSTPKKRKMGD